MASFRTTLGQITEMFQRKKAISCTSTQFFLNAWFVWQAGRYKKAIHHYKKIDDYLSYHDASEDGSEEDKELLKKWNALKLAGLLNLALCQNKIGQYAEAAKNCEKVGVWLNRCLPLVSRPIVFELQPWAMV